MANQDQKAFIFNSKLSTVQLQSTEVIGERYSSILGFRVDVNVRRAVMLIQNVSCGPVGACP